MTAKCLLLPFVGAAWIALLGLGNAFVIYHGPHRLQISSFQPLVPCHAFHGKPSALWAESDPSSMEGNEESIDDGMPALPAKDSNVTAFDYFKDGLFFLREIYRTAFVEDTGLPLRNMTVHELFDNAWTEEQAGGRDGVSEYFEQFGINSKQTRIVYDKWKEINNIRKKDVKREIPRMVSVDYQIQNTSLSHTYDLERFSEHIEDLFTWYKDVARGDKTFVGPYFCFIQSSGMGKTKLMFEYQKISREKFGIEAFLILTMDLKSKGQGYGKIFDFHVDLGEIADRLNTDIDIDKKEPANEAAELVFRQLERILGQIRKRKQVKHCDKIALLFDESQSLLNRRFGYDAFVFRCVRMWLRYKRRELHVVAVFAGTNLKLTDFLVESDRSLPGVRPSREFRLWKEEKFHPRGAMNRAPFVQTMTMGSCLPILKDANVTNEYERAVYYGRPLFALIAKDGNLESKTPTALARMLLENDWEGNRNTWINILATRIQMGQTTIEVASDLVSNGYANLMGYFEETNAVEIGYLPDPVCARLAMCMMDESFRSRGLPPESLIIKGKNKRWWTKKLMRIFSSGIVNPERGNLGEVVVALYMLFCGDVLRKEINEFEARKKKRKKADQPYVHFSVPLHSWLHTMQSGGRPPESSPTSATGGEASNVSVGFIQVYRNPLRSYFGSWSRLKNKSFLKNIYESGTAFYVFPGCPLIDVVIPLRITTGKDADGRPTFDYMPMLVSIKCHWQLRETDADADIAAMETRAKESGLDRVLCLLLVFASNPKSLTYIKDITINDFEEVSELLAGENGGIVSKTIRIPDKDVFGLTAAFKDMTPASVVSSELFSAHSTIKAHEGDIEVENDLRDDSRKAVKDKYKAINKAMSPSIYGEI